eukprot:TRINITY_DN71610_c0_g1_i5.p1 TRINITY_DN71610_c0_g1~~TRINITY_DN71610_c0_g1_i5.p1  ORF type:complete len:431 (+),score=78.62 TRINITY_DN71610_c0_g1_i5:2054-3346(+)
MATDNKYDRQLRLWGADGQKLLSEAKIAVIGSSAVASESLKNLVLPGCGSFTIFDAATVHVSDCECNFFVSRSTLGKPRGEVVRDLLVEMNPDVTGNFENISTESLIFENIDMLKTFSFIIICNGTKSELLKLDEFSRMHNIPLIIANCNGLLGYIRLDCAEHTVLNSKKSCSHDLRVREPFPALVEFVDSIDMDSLSEMEYVHVPYVVVLIKFAKLWLDEHDSLPEKYSELKSFKEFMQNGCKRHYEDAANFMEAIENSTLIRKWNLPEPLETLLNDSKLKREPEVSDSDFWISAAALKVFFERKNTIPLSSQLPDMTSTSEMYAMLQRAYNQQAKNDLDEMNTIVSELCDKIGRKCVSEAFIEGFTRHCRGLAVLHYRSLNQELNSPILDMDDSMDMVAEQVNFTTLIFFSLWNIFCREIRRQCYGIV